MTDRTAVKAWTMQTVHNQGAWVSSQAEAAAYTLSTVAWEVYLVEYQPLA